MASQVLYIAVYSGEYEKAFPTKLILFSKFLKLLLTGKVTASLPPLKQKKRKRKRWDKFGNHSYDSPAVHNNLYRILANCLTIQLPAYLWIVPLPSSTEIVPSPSRLVY